MSGTVPPPPYWLSRSEQRKIPLSFRANRNPSQQLGYGLDNQEIDSWKRREVFISSNVLILALESRSAALQ